MAGITIPVTGGAGLPASGAGGVGGNGGVAAGGKPPKNPQGLPKPRVVAPQPISVTAQPKSTHPDAPNAPHMHQVQPPSGRGNQGIQNPLAPLSSTQINKQAINTITKAYAPAFSDLNSTQSRTQAIADKRQSDDKYYMSWLDTQTAGLQAHAEAAQTALVGALGPGPIAAAAPNAPQTSYGNGALNPAQNPYGGQAAEGLMNSTRANNFAYAAAMSSKQQSDLQTALGTIGQDRTKLNLSQTSDITKEINRLQGVELNKAQSNRNFGALVDKLGIQQAGIQAGLTKAQLASQTSLANTNSRNQTSLTNTNSRNQTSRANSQLGAQTSRQNAQLSAQTSKDNNIRSTSTSAANAQLAAQTRRSVAAATAARQANKPVSAKDQRTLYKTIDDVKGEIQFLQTHGYTGAAAYRAIAGSQRVPIQIGVTSSGKPKTTTYIYKNPGDQLLNAGYSAASGGLTAGDEAALQKLGLDPNRYADRPDPVPFHNTAPSGGALH